MASLRSSFVPSDCASLAGLDRGGSRASATSRSAAVVGRDRLADERRAPRRRAAADAAASRSGSCARCRGVVHSWSETMPFQGCLDQLLAELDGLGQDDLFLGGQQGDLADLLEVHPDRVVDPDHVGRDRLELLGGGLLELLRRRAWPARRRAAWRPDRRRRRRRRPRRRRRRRPRRRLDDRDRDRRRRRRRRHRRRWRRPPGARRAKTGELGLLELGLAATRPRQDGLDELLVQGIVRTWRLPPGGWREQAGLVVGAGRATGALR